MTQPLGVWRVPASNDGDEPEPQRVEPGAIGLEKIFEDWIARDATLITDGATIVGRQVTVDQSGRLDLLAIDAHDHWLVIEVKPGPIGHGALSQALYYAGGIASLGAEALLAKLAPGLAALGDADDLTADMRWTPTSGRWSRPPPRWWLCGSRRATTTARPGPRPVPSSSSPSRTRLPRSWTSSRTRSPRSMPGSVVWEMRLDGVETRLRAVEVDVAALKTDVGALKNDVAYLRDRQEERGGAA